MVLNISARLSIIGIVSALLCVGGLYIIFSDTANYQIKPKQKITEDSDFYKSWRESQIPIYMQFYFFNVTNAKEYSDNSSIKPILQQLGPYTYREYRKKVNITFNDDGTVSYNQIKWYVYDEKKSVGSLEDKVTTVNVPLVSIGIETDALRTNHIKLVVKSVVRLHKSKLFVTKTVDELLFKGYYDNFIAYLASKSYRTNLPNNTFGFFYQRNGTDDGRYTVYTGEKDSSKFLQIARLNNKDKLDYWNDDYCNMINGTDGSMFQPFLKKEDTIRLFSPDLCRSVYMDYQNTNNVHGIKTYRFAPFFSMMAAPDINPDNKCFCPDDNECLSGTLQISACTKGTPIVLSSPHFYQGDDRYYTAIDGLNRNKLEHGTFLDIEPTTGTVVRAAMRLQINIRLRAVDHIPPMQKLNPITFPIFWVNESVHLDEAGAERFKRIKDENFLHTI